MTAEWEHWERPSPWRRWGLRLLALLVLAAVAVALWQIYQAAIADDDPAPTPVAAELEAMAEPADALARRLDALKPDGSPARARTAAKRAIAATRAAARAAGGDAVADTKTGARIANAVDAEREWLNAVNATLRDPSSRLRRELGDRGERAKRALGALPDDHGLAATVRGAANLRAWARAND